MQMWNTHFYSHATRSLDAASAQNLCPDPHDTLHKEECYQKVWQVIPAIISLFHVNTLSLCLSL